MPALLAYSARAFDAFEARWESPVAQRRLARLLVASFLAALALIEVNRQALLPGPFPGGLTRNHFGAVAFSFTLLLFFELVGLVLALARSVANSVGKQFELFSLILLRKAFLELGNLGEPIEWEHAAAAVPVVLTDIGGALLVFVAIGIYYRLQRHRPITAAEEEQLRFVASKKAVGFLLLVGMTVLGAQTLLRGETTERFLETFYTLLVLSDVLLVLLSLQHGGRFAMVFRNSGFAAVTVILRLALTAPAYLNAALGVAAALLALALTAAFNGFVVELETPPRDPAVNHH